MSPFIKGLCIQMAKAPKVQKQEQVTPVGLSSHSDAEQGGSEQPLSKQHIPDLATESASKSQLPLVSS